MAQSPCHDCGETPSASRETYLVCTCLSKRTNAKSSSFGLMWFGPVYFAFGHVSSGGFTRSLLFNPTSEELSFARASSGLGPNVLFPLCSRCLATRWCDWVLKDMANIQVQVKEITLLTRLPATPLKGALELIALRKGKWREALIGEIDDGIVKRWKEWNTRDPLVQKAYKALTKITEKETVKELEVINALKNAALQEQLGTRFSPSSGKRGRRPYPAMALYVKRLYKSWLTRWKKKGENKTPSVAGAAKDVGPILSLFPRYDMKSSARLASRARDFIRRPVKVTAGQIIRMASKTQNMKRSLNS